MMQSFPWWSFVFFTFTNSITPGPNVIMLTTSGTYWGYRKTLPHLLGVCFGFPLMFLVVQFGMGALFERLPWIFPLLTLLSLLYVLWYSHRVYQMGAKNFSESAEKKRPMNAIAAILFQWINGRAWQIAITTSTLYAAPNNAIKLQAAAIYILILFLSGSCWVEIGKRIKYLLGDARRRKIYYSALAISLMAATFPTGLKQLWAAAFGN